MGRKRVAKHRTKDCENLYPGHNVRSASSINCPPAIFATSLWGMGVYPGPIRKALPRVGGVEESAEVPPEEPPVIKGGNAGRVKEGREDTTAGEPRVLYVEIKGGMTSICGNVEDWR